MVVSEVAELVASAASQGRSSDPRSHNFYSRGQYAYTVHTSAWWDGMEQKDSKIGIFVYFLESGQTNCLNYLESGGPQRSHGWDQTMTSMSINPKIVCATRDISNQYTINQNIEVTLYNMHLLRNDDTPRVFDVTSLNANQLFPDRPWYGTHAVRTRGDGDILTKITNLVHRADDSSSSCKVLQSEKKVSMDIG